MDKVFVYGVSVKGDNFTDRDKEIERLKLNLENGMNTILISPRRLGKTSMVKKVISQFKEREDILPVYMDIYDCRSEYDFYNRFAAAIIQQTTSKVDYWVEYAKEFLSRITPKIVLASDGINEVSLALGITPSTHAPEEVLALPEKIAKKRGKHIVVCIDEFQQIGEMPNSLTIQKRLRSVWQHQSECTYCLFGSKKHLMDNLFQDKRMPFFLFGEMMYLDRIPTADWVSYIQGRFESRGKKISVEICKKICEYTQNYSSYVQQLAWNVFAETEHEAGPQELENGLNATMQQNHALFQQQIAGLSSFQLNMLRAVAWGHHKGFTTTQVLNDFNLGSKSNVAKLQTTLIEKELLEKRSDGLFFADPLFARWFAYDQSIPQHI